MKHIKSRKARQSLKQRVGPLRCRGFLALIPVSLIHILTPFVPLTPVSSSPLWSMFSARGGKVPVVPRVISSQKLLDTIHEVGSASLPFLSLLSTPLVPRFCGRGYLTRRPNGWLLCHQQFETNTNEAYWQNMKANQRKKRLRLPSRKAM